MNINVTLEMNGSCQWVYQLEADNTSLRPVLAVAACLNLSQCILSAVPVDSSVTVQRSNSTGGGGGGGGHLLTYRIHERLAVACTLRRESSDQQNETSDEYNHHDYDDGRDYEPIDHHYDTEEYIYDDGHDHV